MKKKLIRKLVAIALGATTCLAVGAAILLKPTTKADAANDVEITSMSTLEGFTILEKAAIRKNNRVGLRFTTEVSSDTQTQIEKILGTGEIAYGTLMIPADFLVGGELTHDTPSVVDRMLTENEWKDTTTYTVVLGGAGGVDLGESYYSRPIAARSYALNKDTGAVCYTENTTIRSLGYVAYKAEEIGETGENVTKIANSAYTTRELTFNEGVSIYNSETSGYDVIGNGIKESASVFAFKVGGIVDESKLISYTSTDTSVISVNGNTVTAVGEGMATVAGSVTVDGVGYSCTHTLNTTGYTPSSAYEILVPQNAGEYEMQAAKKMQSVMQEATGIKLAIVTESKNETTDGKYISIGETSLAQEICVLSSITDEKQLGETSSVVRVVKNAVFVRGMSERATLYGVQQLLKDTVGYEYFLKDTYVVNENSEFVITNRDYIPDIANEVIQQQTAEDGIIAAEHGTHGYTAFMVPVGADDYSGIVHNSIKTIATVDATGVANTSPSYKYSSLTYKDWYATNGNSFLRDSNNNDRKLELCYTAHGNTSTENGRPALVDAVATAMFNQMRRDEYKSYDRIGFSQADHGEWCNCTACTSEGNAADNLLHFILDVAASLKSKLQTVGDSRASTFKICTLFYLATSTLPTSNATYLDETTKAYMSHLEGWFAEIKADFNVPLNTETNYNPTAKNQFDGWSSFLRNNGADMLWWGYYANTKCGFIPYDSISALRGNYALAYDAGVDYMFNQAIGYNVNWTRLKQYLMSELRWNANPGDATWNGWIESYMKGAFGQGWEEMNTYFTSWQEWASDHKDDFYNAADGSSPSISKELRTKSAMPIATLTAWLNSCNQAIAALDVNDPNYKTYYNNIVLERLTPLYLIMYVHGGFQEKTNFLGNGTGEYKFTDTSYVTPYGQDFLDGIALWNVGYDGEMTYNQLPEFTDLISSTLSGISTYEETARQNVLTATSITLNSANIASGEAYTATLVSKDQILSTESVTANEGKVVLTLDSAPAVGSYVITLRSSSKVITFTDVLVVTGLISNYTEFKALTSASKTGYYLLTADINADGATLVPGARANFSAVLDGDGHTVSGIILSPSAMFMKMTNATVKDITFANVQVTADMIFTTSATNTTFENVKVSLIGTTEKTYVKTVSNVAYKNVSTTYIEGEQTGKTFFLPIGETEVLIQDANLVKGDYTIILGGERTTARSYKNGQLKVKVNSLAVGETVSVVCDNDTNAYIYNVMGITKFIKTFDELLALGLHSPDDQGEGYGNDVYGYYVLANDIDGQGAFTTPGYNYGRSYFQGTLDGNGYTVKNFTAGQCGIFGGMMNATVKNINFDFASVYTKSNDAGWNYTALLANRATNVVFENVNARFFDYQAVDGDVATFFKGTLVGEASENVTYRNVTIDLSLCTDEFVASGGNVFGPAVNGLVCEDVTIKVGLAENEVTFGYSDKVGTEISKPDGVTVETISVDIVTASDATTALPYYMDDVTKVGFVEDTLVQVYDGNGEASIKVDSTQYDYVEVDLYIETANDTSFFFLRAYKNGSNVNGGKAYVVDPSNIRLWDNTPADREIQVFDANGKAINTLMKKNTFYTLRVDIKTGEIDKITIQQENLNIYLANVRFGVNEYVPENAPTNASSTTLPRYTGDETAYGWEEDTYVFEATMASSWNDRVVFNVDSTKYDYMDVDFVITNDRNVWWFSAWVVNAGGMLDGSYTLNENSGFANHTPNKGANGGNTKIQVFDVNGNVLTGARTTGTKYTLRVYLKDENLTQVQFGQDNVTMLFANVTFGIIETVVSGGSNVNAVTVYEGDETALGFAEGSRVYKYEGVNTSTDKAAIAVDSSSYDYVDVQLVISEGDGYFFLYALKGGNFLNSGSSYVIDPSNIRLASGSVMDRYIQVFDANGKMVSSLMSKNTLYTLRVYIKAGEVDQIMLGKNASTIYLANVSFGNGEPVYPVVQGDNRVDMPTYDGDVTTLGFETDTTVYVLENATPDNVYSDGWNKRAIIYTPTTQDYVTFEFVSTVDVAAGSDVFHIWGANGSPSIGSVKTTTTDIALITDVNGYASTNIAAGAHYYLHVACANLKEIQIASIIPSSTVYFANIEYNNGAFAAAEKPATIIMQGNPEIEMPSYTGKVTELGFAEGDFVQQMVTQDLTAGSQWWDTKTYPDNLHRQTYLAKIPMDASQTKISIEFAVSEAIASGEVFHIWAYEGDTYLKDVSVSCSTTWADSGLAACIYDKNGNAVSSLQANTVYVLEMSMPGATRFNVANIAESGMTTYFSASSIKYEQVVTLPDEVVKSAETDEVLPKYTGDQVSMGFGADDYVFEAVFTKSSNDAPWAERVSIGDSDEPAYLVFDFAIDVPSTLCIWVRKDGNMLSGNYNLASNGIWSVAGAATERNFYVVDADGNGLNGTMQANTKYTVYVQLGGTIDNIHISTYSGACTMYFANVRYMDGVEQMILQGSTTNTVHTLYNGDVTALGFAEGSFVQQMVTQDLTAGSQWWDTTNYPDNLHRQTYLAKIPMDASQTKISIEFAVSEAIASGEVFQVWAYKDGMDTALANCTVSCSTTWAKDGIAACIYDKNGNAVSSLQANTVYVLEMRMPGATRFNVANIAASGMTTYFSASSIKYGAEIYQGDSRVKASAYQGDATQYGFAATDDVVELAMTDFWSDRAIVKVDSTVCDYVDIDFVVTSGLWYFNAWVVTSSGMLDGSYLVAELSGGTQHATYGAGFAKHNPSTGASGGNTRMQVLDASGNVVIGGRALGTKYTLRVYICDESLTEIQFGQSNTNVLIGNVRFGTNA